MAEIDRQRIKSIYSEIKGFHASLPSSGGYSAPVNATENYNNLLDKLGHISKTSFVAHEIIRDDNTYNGYGYNINEVRMSMGAVISRLESDYGFGESVQSSSAPIVVTVNQNQQMQVTVQSIAQLIHDQENEEVKHLLRELENATSSRDEDKSKDIIKNLADKSWSVFLKVLPYVLEHWGKSHS